MNFQLQLNEGGQRTEVFCMNTVFVQIFIILTFSMTHLQAGLWFLCKFHYYYLLLSGLV